MAKFVRLVVGNRVLVSLNAPIISVWKICAWKWCPEDWAAAKYEAFLGTAGQVNEEASAPEMSAS